MRKLISLLDRHNLGGTIGKNSSKDSHNSCKNKHDIIIRREVAHTVNVVIRTQVRIFALPDRLTIRIGSKEHQNVDLCTGVHVAYYQRLFPDKIESIADLLSDQRAVEDDALHYFNKRNGEKENFEIVVHVTNLFKMVKVDQDAVFGIAKIIFVVDLERLKILLKIIQTGFVLSAIVENVANKNEQKVTVTVHIEEAITAI